MRKYNAFRVASGTGGQHETHSFIGGRRSSRIDIFTRGGVKGLSMLEDNIDIKSLEVPDKVFNDIESDCVRYKHGFVEE